MADEVNYNDSQRDYSYNSLTQEEKQEISLFHSLKQDPYFKHYLHHHMSMYAEETDTTHFGMVNTRPQTSDIYDHPRFEKLNIFDFRRNLP